MQEGPAMSHMSKKPTMARVPSDTAHYLELQSVLRKMGPW